MDIGTRIEIVIVLYFICFISYAIYKEKKIHKNKPKFKKKNK